MIVKESFYMRKFCISLAPFFIVKTYIVKTYYFTGQPCWDDIIESTVDGRMQKEHGRAATQWLLQNVYNTHFHTVGDKQQLDFKMKHHSVKARPTALKNNMTVWFTLLFVLNMGIQQH